MRRRTWAVSRIPGPRRQRASGSSRSLPTGPFVRRSPFTWAAFLASSTLIFLTAAPAATAGAQPTATGALTIAALGDSYSSGEGSPPFLADAGSCRRSTGAWPRLLATLDPPITTVLHAACGGATTKELTTSRRGNPSQLDQLRALPKAPDVVTITIGGNDAGFGRVIMSCVLWKCFWDGNDRRRRDYLQDELPGILVTTYKEVKAAAPNSRIVVVGYPDIFPRSQRNNTCRWLDSSERRQLVSLNNTLNRTIRRAAKDAGVEFVATSRSLRDHEMCTKDSWVNRVGLLSADRDLSAHPTQAGQEAMARTIHDALVDKR
ncbi:Lysophospholipase L1 [Parafrankia irregularis]|uniref:Lysophospholipase L1 n=1 Tax=Parafrankia irregularis TaxID=795642 RepID=A0A0S4QQ68_9ACTN|nr:MULTISPECIES: SGNH/GDSL hydrolase family protein [Parafrankia]MBE3204473.1 SGNH/GDSL hydrolase family protein [Parafrankia sp. CH37]CUU57749.1 Lysophospholipase L1 [Parafrankia irregularis]